MATTKKAASKKAAPKKSEPGTELVPAKKSVVKRSAPKKKAEEAEEQTEAEFRMRHYQANQDFISDRENRWNGKED